MHLEGHPAREETLRVRIISDFFTRPENLSGFAGQVFILLTVYTYSTTRFIIF